MWIKLAIAGAIALSLMAAVGSFIHAQREIGRADVRAQFAEAKAEQEAANAKKAQEGKAHAEKLLAKAAKQAQQRAAQAASAALARQAASDARAADDIAYALWRESRVDRIDADRLRQFAQSITATADSRGVPNRLPTGTSPADPTRSPDQRGAGGIRFSPLGTIAGWLGFGGASGK